MLIDGKKLAKKINAQTKATIIKSGRRPGLAAVLVGDNPASELYVSLKAEAASKVGIYFEKHELTGNSDPSFAKASEGRQGAVISLIEKLNNDPKIHGIIVQLPLPQSFDTDEVIKTISPDKDADGFHPKNLKKLLAGKKVLLPVMAQVVSKLLESTNESLKGKKAVLIAKSDVFSQPICFVLEKAGTSCQHVSPQTDKLKEVTLKADILISAIGQPRAINGNMVKDRAIVIDIGTTKLANQLVGDVDFDSVKPKAAWITPVPGGVGPVTVAMLLKNVFELARKQ